MRILCVVGARPNYMKIKPVVDACERENLEVALVHTGQHYDPSMNDVFFEDLGIRPPDRHLNVGSGSHAAQTAKIMLAFEPVVKDLRPDAVVVVGDVNSTVACALVAAKEGALVAHVEAGLRSRDWEMPEEINRVVTDRMSDYLFAPSPDAVENLVSEGYRDDQIHLVGNVMVDSLLTNLPRTRDRTTLADQSLVPKAYGLVTLHRPSNVDRPEALRALLRAFGQISEHLPLLFPAHPRTAARLAAQEVPSGLRVIEPVGYLDFLALQAGARVVLTDSGGIQEETTVLGVPCLTLRKTTERPITIQEGTNQLVGTDPERIVTITREVIKDGVRPRRPKLWDGKAGERIARVLSEGGPAIGHVRPTDVSGGPGPVPRRSD